MKITVKALDSGNAEFDLPEEVTVQELKEKIVERMGIPLDKQRLIFQGKVLKDDQQLKEYGVADGKVIHLVHSAPPPAGGETVTAEPTTQASEVDAPRIREDVLFVSSVPMHLGAGDITSMTQTLVDGIVGSLTAAGHTASVSAHARAVDRSGQTHEAVLTASTAPDGTPPAPPTGPTMLPPTVPTTMLPPTVPTTLLPPIVPTATPSTVPTATPSTVPTATPSTIPTATPSTVPTATPSSTATPPVSTAPPPLQVPRPEDVARDRLIDEAERRRLDQEQREADRNRRQLRTIHVQKKTCRRCIQFAKKILDRYDRAEARRAARRRQQEAEAAGSTEEPMEVSDKPPEEEMDTTDPTAADQEDDGEYQPIPAEVYTVLMTDIEALQVRARPLVERYLEHIREEKAMEEDAALAASRIAQTVKDFNYYIGHAFVALSRLHVNMGSNPPRLIRLTPPRRTEMRRLMQQIRTLPPPRQPQGYIVDITRDAPEGVEGPGHLTQTTSTTITPMAGAGPQGQSGYRLGPITVGATFSMRNPDQQGAEGAEEGEEDGEKRTIDVDVTALPGSQEHMVNIRDSATGTTETQTLPAQGPSHTEERKPKPEREGKEGAAAEGEEKEKEKEGEEDDDDDDEPVPQLLARLLSDLIRGVAGGSGGDDDDDDEDDDEDQGEQGGRHHGEGGGGGEDGKGGGAGEAGEGGGAGEGGEGRESHGGGEGGEDGEGQQASGGGEEDAENRPLSFAERYAGPEGTTVTIEQQPPVGYPQFPGLPPMRGPSISIRNPGGGQRPEVSVNLPMPPALQLLQTILERRQRERQQQGEGGEPPPRPREPPKPFEDEDGEIESISDAGSIDSIDSNHSEPPELENPMSRIATAAMEELHTGTRQSMHATLSELREEYGAPPDDDDDDADLGMVEQLLQTISRELSVVEVMGVFRGSIDPIQQLQPALINFVREHCLNGAKPTPDRRDQAVETFLSGCIPGVTLVQEQAPIREGIDFPQTVYDTLARIFKGGYDIINSTHVGDMAFAHATHAWGTKSSGLFASVIRHCVVSDEDFETTVKQLLTAMFPPSTPTMIITMCSSSILNEMRRLKDNVTFKPEELDVYIIWKEGATPQPNPNPAKPPPPPASSVLADGQPLPIVPPPSEDVATSSEAASEDDGEKWPEGMPKDWIPAIKQDREALTRTRPQQPFSDAYLSGMPAKRRKLDTTQSKMTTAPQLLEQTLQHAITTSGATPTSGASVEVIVSEAKDDPELVSALSETMYYNMRERLQGDSDYDPERFPNAQSFYHPRK